MRTVSTPSLQAYLQPLAPIVAPPVSPFSKAKKRPYSVTPPPQFVPPQPAKNAPEHVAELQPALVLMPNSLTASSSADAGGIRAYRITLARLLGGGAWRTQLAADMQGRLEVGIAVSAGGMVETVGLVSSSGNALLDQQICAAVSAVAGLAPIPKALQGEAFVVVLPVEVGVLAAPISAAGQ